ncbi:MAG TPA: hypothetical protein VFB54_18165 [Burkholderiales bacterium]|nr:hypothetical protein [Burkholderiales bacterium]
MSKSLLLIAAAVATVSSCASQNARQSSEEVKHYCAEKFADHRIDPIREKILIPISIDQPQPIEILANRQRPTGDEKRALLALAEAREACNRYADAHLGAPPAYRAASQDRVTAALSDLYAGDTTYGDFAKTLLFIGDRDKMAHEDMERAFHERERWRDLDAWN